MDDVESVYPLTGMQQGMLLRVLRHPGSGEYVEQVSWTLEGDLDEAAFARAWRLAADRHPVLRTAFLWEGLEQPLQVVRSGREVPVEERDWRGAPAAERGERLADFLAEDRARGFDLAVAPLTRLTVFRLSGSEAHWVWTYHHLLLDGWSASLCLRDVFAGYDALRRGEEPRLPPATPFERYVAWSASRDPAAGEAFWREALAGFEGADAPGVLRPGAREGERYGVASAALEGGLVERLEAAARRHQLTPNTLFQGAWGALLAAYAGGDDVVFGSVASGRAAQLPGAEEMLGVFINTVPVRVRSRPGEPAADVLRALQAQQLRARAHEHWPLARVQAWSGVPRGRRLFETMFVFQNLPDVGVQLAEVAGLRLRDFDRASPPAGVGYALVLEVVPRDGLELRLVHDEARFDADAAHRLLAQLRTLLEALASDPLGVFAELPLLSPAERRLLAERSAPRPAPDGLPVHLRIAAQAARTPDAIAVVAGEEALTWAELDRRSDGLAGELRRRGVGPETPVGVCTDRSPELVVALLGVWKAGGAWVPLDPAYPAGRLAFMLEDSGARVLVTQGGLAERFAGFGGEVVEVGTPLPPAPSPARGEGEHTETGLHLRDAPPPERGRVASLSEPGGGLPGGGSPSLGHLAYVIYTSGSTGAPKGVRVEHRQLAATLDAAQAAFGFAPGDRMASLASQAFDIWLFETVLPLMAGAAVRLVPAERVRDVPALVREVADATLLHAVPALMRQVVEETAASGVRLPLRQVFVGGDAVPPGLPERMRGAWPEARAWVLYGPTEGTVICAAGRLDEGRSAAAHPLGRPLGSARLHVRSPAGEPLPVGVPGELCIGGEGVARDYLGRPELTAERFVPDPFGERGARLYRTGDRARWLADGTLEFLGRMDQQVKLRGFRVEPGEVAAALERHPGVREAAVVAREDGDGEPRLVAYFTAEGEAPAPGELRAGLRERLPEHMVPAAFVALEALPRTPTGKLDRGALPAPESAGAGDGRTAPRTPTEELVAAAYAAVLGGGPVGAETDFFERGGHSLMATRLISRLREAGGVELPLGALFEAPTVEGLAARVDALLRAGGTAQAPPLVPVPRDGRPLPLSFAQQRLWFLDRMEPGSAAYNMPAALRVRGPLDAEALRRALSETVRRHEALRTVVGTVAGEPVQTVRDPAPFPLEVVDLRGLGEAEREAELLRRAREAAARPFDLAEGPLIRAALLRLAEGDAALLVTLHHLVSDGWSVGLLIREVSALYEAFARGEAPELPAPPVQYADYAVWQRDWLSGEALDGQVAYWRERLAGAPPVLELPADRPRAARAGAPGDTVGFALSPEAAAGLRGLARREGATLFMALLAGWQALLGRLAGTEDVVVGGPVAGRTRRELEGVVGLFVNTLALRTDLSGDPTVGELLARVRAATLGAHAHQELPFERLVEALGVPRDPAHTPVFQVLFDLENEGAEKRAFRLGGAAAERMEVDAGAAKFDLALAMADEGERIAGRLEYRSDLFEAETARRTAERLGVLLEAMAAGPARRLSELEWFTPAERRRVLELGAGAEALPDGLPVHLLVSAQAARTPDAVAVASGGRSLTYAALEAASARLADGLRARGVGPETRVAVCLERGPELVAAALAVLRAGGAYVPLDPGHPAGRLAWMLEDSGARVLVTQEGLAERFAGFGGEVVEVGTPLPPAPSPARGEGEHTETGLHLRDAPPPERGRVASLSEPGGGLPGGGSPSLDHLAYVIYTSGSTGAPKGVGVEHRSLAATFARAQRAFGFGPGDTMPALASSAFDIWLFEALLPLTRGARVRLVAAGRVADAEALVEELADATMLHAVPALMRQVVEQVAASGRALPAVRRLFVGGDAVPPELPARMRAAFPGAEVHVLYGPTEGAIVCASVPAGDAEEHRRLVGRPLGNAALYVCDARGALVPAGVPGELRLGGAAVARGYLGRPELTAERWVPDPFSGEPGARLYRTGDRVRWGADGVLEFLGRTDAQVKVRGFRIEPGEVEAALAAHPAVREAAVVLRDLGAGGPGLVAYYVPAADGPEEAAVLRDWLRARLPEYMAPAAFVALDALPLTPTGKLDRGALPAPEGAADGAAHAAPRTPAEELLAGAWADVLGVERVGVRDDFFALGGHSLLATRLISRVREALGVELPLRALFDAPTVEGLAARVEALLRAGGTAQAPPLVPAARDGRPLPLSFAQQRLWFLDRMEPGSAAYNMPAALRVRGPLDAEALRRSLEEVVRRHEALRTVFRAAGGEPAQVVLDPAPFPLETVELRGAAGEEREAELLRRAREEAARPFDLAEGPLLRATLLRLGEEDAALLFTMHHVVSDGWSIGLLVREVSALYGALVRGEEPALPELPVQYADYAVWQRGWLRGAALEEQIGYWKERLAGAPPVLELPADRRRPAVPSARGGAVAFELRPEAARALRELARREGATLFMTLFAGWQALLGRYAGTEDVVSGTAVAGRTRRETEGLIGFFVNTLALRTDLAGDPTVGALLGRVRETVLEAHAHQELPFERLVEELGVRRDLAHTPLFQVVFTLQDEGGEAAALRLGEARAEPLAVGTEAVKFDLALSMADEGERLTGRLEYRADLFEAETARRMAEHLGVLLEAMAAGPERRLSELEWVPPAERRRVVEEWNDTARPVPREAIHALFAEQAARTPGAVALVGPDGGRTTYAELDAAGNRLANGLRRRGVGPETRVGIFMERSAELVAAMLGVLKAGGTYVPLDPDYPAERLAYLVADSGVRVVLAQERLLERVPPGPAETVCVDAGGVAAGPESAAPPARETALSPEQLAYVIYTSGSTGTPKGAAVPHRAVVRLVRGADFVRLDAGEVLLQISAAGFDVSTFEVWGALLNGARLVVPPPGIPTVPELEALLAREGVTTLWLTSGLFHLVADERPRALAGVRQLLAGGDVLSPDHVRRALEALPGVRLVNGYGPTENTTFTACHTVRPDDPARASIPIGRPISNTRAYVLDDGMRPVAVGVPGELYAGGAGLARGYLDRPAATAEKWVPDPFSREPGGRLYRTGDRARWLADGTLEFLGRLDQQVKVRGFRIEPGEIEAALHAHLGVRDAAVVVREDAPGDRRLVAYVVAADGDAPPAAELRGHLRVRLPEYMVPAAFVALEGLPLTAHGKLDRRALPAPEGGSAREYVAPRTPTETLLAAVWSELLRVERVGTQDNFFDLGGHSLLLVQLHARLQERFGDGVSITDLFQFSTLGDLAAHLDRPREAPGDAHRENVERAESRRTGLQRQRAARSGARGRGGS